MRLVERSPVSSQSSHLKYRQDLRRDFGYSCAYCTIAETEAKGIAFEIDHYLPEKHFPELAAEYGNLMYACDSCNGSKSNYYPETDSELDACRRFFRPDWDRRPDHFRLKGDSIQGVSPPGEYTVEMLFLYREALTQLRALRRRLVGAEELVEGGVEALRGVPIDRLPRNIRLRVLAARRQLAEKAMALQDLIEAALGPARSQLLDEDPDHQDHLARRRAYLAQTTFGGTR